MTDHRVYTMTWQENSLFYKSEKIERREQNLDLDWSSETGSYISHQGMAPPLPGRRLSTKLFPGRHSGILPARSRHGLRVRQDCGTPRHPRQHRLPRAAREHHGRGRQQVASSFMIFPARKQGPISFSWIPTSFARSIGLVGSGLFKQKVETFFYHLSAIARPRFQHL